MMRKRVVLEFALPDVCVNETKVDNGLNKNRSSAKTTTPMVKEQSRKYRGVRPRQSGRWDAEIRNPFEGRREWLVLLLVTFENKFVPLNGGTKSDTDTSNASTLPELGNSVSDVIESSTVSINEAIVESLETNNRLEAEFFEQNVLDLSPLNVVQQSDFVENSDISRYELDWLTFDGSRQGLDDLGCLEDLRYCDFDKNYGLLIFQTLILMMLSVLMRVLLMRLLVGLKIPQINHVHKICS
ncbi:hypothetical protein TSUD_410090 [Trifolium subterraneum]|uniref:AP2/ERF domain-containing protein n=1 Tax=Trifolium subterraneum TaxID=3900 RepID=A0A2Z6PST8_TRISU|nr:hypothetical protein TSUD_410090 [Trifolium subterraneum]